MASKSKEVKVSLKLAKESIQVKDYAAAVEHCRRVLEVDSGNYHALVFLGVAHENRNEDTNCLDAYSKAVEISPDQILAWQGLISYYEKKSSGVNQQKLITTYEKVIGLLKNNADNDEKVFQLELKLANMCIKVGEKARALTCYQALLQKIQPSESVCEKVTSIHNKILQNVDLKNDDEVCRFSSSVEYFLFNNLTCDSLSTDELCTVYLATFHHKCVDELSAVCHELWSRRVPSVVPLEISISISLDRLIVLGEAMSENTLTMAEEIEKKVPNSFVLQAWKAHNMITERRFSEAKKLATVLSDGKVAAFRLLLVQSDAGLHDTNSVTRNTRLLLKELDELKIYSDKKTIARTLLLLQVDALLQENNSESFSEAGQLCKQLKLEHNCLDVDIMLCHLCLVLGNDTAAAKICDRLTGNSHAELAAIGWYQYHTDQLDSAVRNLKSAIEKSPNEPRYLYQLARIYWKLMLGESLPHQLVMATLLKAAKLDPFHSNTFFWLGRYFEKFSQDFEKSQRCYRKAYDLKPSNETAAEYLVTSLDRLGLKDVTLQVLRSVTERASAGGGGAKWAWLRLGLYQVKDDPSAAIQCFQSAIRVDPTDAYCWQCLAEGYLSRGSFNAAMKTFTKANDLDPSCMYNLFQMASIKQLIGLHLEAVEDYKKIIRESIDYVPALKGLAETHIHMANEAMGKFYSQKALDNCSLAIGYLTRAAVKRPDLAMIWKLIGDALIILGDVSDTVVRMSVPGKLCGEMEDKELGLRQLLELGARSYRTALQISDDDAVIWHDLGVNYYYQAKVTGATDCRIDAVNCLKKSLMLNSTDAKVWSSLGVVLSKSGNKAGGQHCFIQAVELDAQNAQAWTNLGVLYLSSGKVALAHQAFKMAQSMAPEYVNGWIGQAMVAETVSHAETADLYRHSSELAFHEEAVSGYAHWIGKAHSEGCEVPESATMNASDGLARYLDRNPDDAVALNMFGLLLERQGLFRTATDVLRRAVGSAKNDDMLQSTRTNFARVLGKSGNHEIAIAEYRHLTNSYVARGFLLYNAKKFDEASAQYQEALNGAQEADHGQISSMIGRCAYWLGDVPKARLLLLKCARFADPHVQELLSLCAFSLLNDNLEVAGATVEELEKRIDRGTVIDICKLIVLYYVSSGQCNEAISFLEKQIKAYPEKVELSFQPSLIFEDEEDKKIDNLLQSVDARPDSLGKLSEICSEAGNKHDLAFRYAHNAVLCYPDDTTKWLLFSHTVIMKLLHCNNFERCGRYIDGIERILNRDDDANLKKLQVYTALIGEFRTKLNANHFDEEVDVRFLVERMDNNRMVVSFHDSEDEDESVVKHQPLIDGKAVLLHGFMEIIAIGLSLRPDSCSLYELSECYKSSGFRQFDEDVFSRDEAVYNRKCAVKKDVNVKFSHSGLSCRTRYLAHYVATR